VNGSITDTLNAAFNFSYNGNMTPTGYETVFTLGPLDETSTSTIFYIKAEGISEIYKAIGYYNQQWQIFANYSNFFTDPSYIRPNVTVHQFGTDGVPDTHVYHIWQTGTPKEIIDDAVQRHWNGAYTFTYESIFTIGALTNTPSDTFYFKGVRNDGGTYYHAAGHSTTSYRWLMAATYPDFNSDPTWTQAWATDSHKFGTDGQPSGIVYHSTTV
jgi:hypothetical protein